MWHLLHARAVLLFASSTQVSVPERVGGHEYYVEQLPDAPHPRYMRRPVPAGMAAGSSSRGGAAEVVLDVNELATVHGEYVQVRQVRMVCFQAWEWHLQDAHDAHSA